ncbi:hypothetical protein L6R52_27110 [Myxococcota bacterium]|nr:hypothetical protein [Myxococcota bacterium]
MEKIEGEPLHEGSWRYLVEERKVASVLDGEETIRWLRTEYRRLPTREDVAGSTPRPRPPRMDGGTRPKDGGARAWREHALWFIVAEAARRDPDAINFRESTLRSPPLPKISTPVEHRGKVLRTIEDPPPGQEWRYLRASEVPAWLTRQAQRELQEFEGQARPSEILEYIDPSADVVRDLAVHRHGTLGLLEHLSRTLARRYGWTRSGATHFALTGRSPRYTHVGADFYFNRDLPACSRLVLTVDPMLPPEELAEQYRAFRKEVLHARVRSMEEKALRLAEFMIGIVRSRRLTGSERLALWNELNPDRTYEPGQVRNFMRDCDASMRRLTASPLGVPKSNERTTTTTRKKKGAKKR